MVSPTAIAITSPFSSTVAISGFELVKKTALFSASTGKTVYSHLYLPSIYLSIVFFPCNETDSTRIGAGGNSG